MLKKTTSILTLVLILANSAQSQVKYQEGSFVLNGIQLLQDSRDPNAYYYLPPYPRISMKKDSTYEFLFIKYVGGREEQNGGIFHVLLEYTLPPAEVADLEKALRKKKPGAHLAGQVPLLETVEAGENSLGSFQLVSSVLNEENGFTQQIATSGSAPLFPGSKAAIAARLGQQGATLLWNSFQSPTSDVSVTLKAYYEAIAPAYEAVVKASTYALHKYFSTLTPAVFSRQQIKAVVDSLYRESLFSVEVADHYLGSDASKQMDAILNLVTDKLLDVLFDPMITTSATDKQNKAKGSLAALFGRPTQIGYMMTDIRDIRRDTFSFHLSRSAIVKVPVVTAGNLGGFFDQVKEDDRYYRVVDLNDPAYQQQEICFQIDGGYLESFKEIVNAGTVTIRKKRIDHYDFSETIRFNPDAFEKNQFLQTVSFSRLGETTDWQSFEYQVAWSLQGQDTIIRSPAVPGEWTHSSDVFIALQPPFEKTLVEIDADRLQFKDRGIHACHIRFGSILAGKPKIIRTLVLRTTDAESVQKVALYHDPGEEIAYELTWYGQNVERKDPPRKLENDYLYIESPDRQK